MAFPDRQTSNIVLTILFYAVLLSIVYLARRVFVIFAFAIVFAYLIDPVVGFLQRHAPFFKKLRGPHILVAYVGFLVFLAIVVHGVAPDLSKHTGAVFRELPALRDELSSGELATRVAGKYQWTVEQELRLKAFLLAHREELLGLVAAAERMTLPLIGSLFLIPILAVFFLNSGAQLADDAIRIFAPSENRRAVQLLALDLNTMMHSYVRAAVTLGSLSFLYCSTAMLALGYPQAIALGAAAGVLEFIPVAGWMISAAAIISVGVLTSSHWIWMAALLGLWRIIMDYGIAPKIMGHELEIHPLLAIFALLVGGEIGGIVGIYLSIPLVAALRVIWKTCIATRLPAQATQAALEVGVPATKSEG
jgi:predicted PurR-regulated permease PerM